MPLLKNPSVLAGKLGKIFGLNLLFVTLMKKCSILVFAAFIGLSSTAAFAGNAFFGDAPDAQHPWAVHDQNRPQPPRVEPAATVGDAPSDAVVLFDGTENSFESNWQHVKPSDKRKADWTVRDGYMLGVGGAGYIET